MLPSTQAHVETEAKENWPSAEKAKTSIGEVSSFTISRSHYIQIRFGVINHRIFRFSLDEFWYNFLCFLSV